MELARQDQHEERGHHIRWRGDAQHGNECGEIVKRMAVPRRAQDAKRNANEDGNHHRCRAELQRDRKCLADDV